MAGFTDVWLKLREPADHRSRNADLAEALSGHFALRDEIAVLDIGCGTGSNLRAIANLLPARQTWTLVDHDPGLLSAAREELGRWADETELDGDALRLKKGRLEIAVRFRNADLATDLGATLAQPADLVTAQAFFDLASEEFIRDFARALQQRRPAFYTTLTYNGITRWTPRHPADNRIEAAFHRHQLTDKGLGRAAGPTAPLHLADQFKLAGYSVQEGDSPWQLGAADQALIDELHSGHVRVAAETEAVDQRTLESWSALRRTGAFIGHTDTLALAT